jgi:hypothetical protein
MLGSIDILSEPDIVLANCTKLSILCQFIESGKNASEVFEFADIRFIKCRSSYIMPVDTAAF